MDPTEGATRWHRWTVTGTGDVILRMLDVLDGNLPAGWKRVAENERDLLQKLYGAKDLWYDLDATSSHPRIVVNLARPQATQVRGGPALFDRRAAPDLSAAWDQVMRFLDVGIMPAARAAGGEIRMPTTEEVFFSDLPLEVREQLRSFSEGARKSLPLGREEADAWRNFVVSAFRERALVDSRQFTAWLVASGWSNDSAADLNSRFFDQCALLSRYADETSAA